MPRVAQTVMTGGTAAARHHETSTADLIGIDQRITSRDGADTSREKECIKLLVFNTKERKTNKKECLKTETSETFRLHLIVVSFPIF